MLRENMPQVNMPWVNIPRDNMPDPLSATKENMPQETLCPKTIRICHLETTSHQETTCHQKNMPPKEDITHGDKRQSDNNQQSTSWGPKANKAWP